MIIYRIKLEEMKWDNRWKALIWDALEQGLNYLKTTAMRDGGHAHTWRVKFFIPSRVVLFSPILFALLCFRKPLLVTEAPFLLDLSPPNLHL